MFGGYSSVEIHVCFKLKNFLGSANVFTEVTMGGAMFLDQVLTLAFVLRGLLLPLNQEVVPAQEMHKLHYLPWH